MVEELTYTLPATKRVKQAAHVGVVGSGDLEVMIEPSKQAKSQITIRTGINGFKKTWDAVIYRFFAENDVAADVTINDFGATPGVVKIRLSQALEVSENE